MLLIDSNQKQVGIYCPYITSAFKTVLAGRIPYCQSVGMIIYRRSVMPASGRYAMLDDGVGFTLVLWRPVMEQRVGQHTAATVCDGGVSWQIGRQRGTTIA